MDWKFWAGLIMGGLIGLFASLLANYFTPTFSDYVNKRRTGFVEKSKKRAIRNFLIIKNLHEGKKDKYIYLMDRWAHVTIFLMVAVAGVLIAEVVDISAEDWIDEFVWDCSYGLGVVSFGAMLVNYFRVTLVQTRLQNFEEYEAGLIKRWGNLPISTD